MPTDQRSEPFSDPLADGPTIQAATQVSEPTLAFVPKLLGVLVVLAVFGPWMTRQMLDFTRRTIEMLPTLTR